ncbi:GtrA family protein [Herbiconiux liukaitaii]|uniref:GtrA family protein n=1 Tax=Herbiconiux liukaitaii TaxID=3342799 RepID=UPI0035BA0FEA
MIVLIPSYQPDTRLVHLVAELRLAAPDATVLVVDDGSGPEYRPVFESARTAGAQVVGYAENHGKGHALRHGFRQARRHHPGEVVVCADSDGQHRMADILRVAENVSRGVITLGGRLFTGAVPVRSRLGNSVSRGAFRAATGIAVEDTQTGLRGYHPSLLDWLITVKGDRFEYELNVLLEARAAGHRIDEIAIETVYLDHNASSHFRPIVDSVRVMRPLLRFGASSLLAFLIDAIALQVLFGVTGSLIVSVVGARVLSASVNFLVNRQLTFRSRERRPVKKDALRYAALAATLLVANLLLLEALTRVGLPLLLAKCATELVLYVASFVVQRRVVFPATSTRKIAIDAS